MTLKYDSTEMQEAARKFVAEHVHGNIGPLVEYILEKSSEDREAPFSLDDIPLYVDPSEWEQARLNEYLKSELDTTWQEVTGEEWIPEADMPEDEEYDTYTLDIVRDYIRDHAEPKQVLEWWMVSQWLYDRLWEQDEVVFDATGCGLFVWGRRTSGQAILLDGVIQGITNVWVEIQEARAARLRQQT